MVVLSGLFGCVPASKYHALQTECAGWRDTAAEMYQRYERERQHSRMVERHNRELNWPRKVGS